MPPRSEVTRLLDEIRSGDRSAADRLLPLVYDNLRGLAGAVFRAGEGHHTLQPTALVHEAWMKMAGGADQLKDRHHFFAVAARAMRQVLADHAKAHGRVKRGSGRRTITLDEGMTAASAAEIDLVSLHETLEELTELNERHARVVELRMLGGLTVQETANMLDISPATVKADWSMARAWLLEALSEA